MCLTLPSEFHCVVISVLSVNSVNNTPVILPMFVNYFYVYVQFEWPPFRGSIDIDRKNRLLKGCYVPATSACTSKAFFASAINNTNETNKAGGTRHKSVYLSLMSMGET